MVTYPEWHTEVEGGIPHFDRIISRSISSGVRISGNRSATASNNWEVEAMVEPGLSLS